MMEILMNNFIKVTKSTKMHNKTLNFANSKLLPFCSAVIFPVTVTPVVATKVGFWFWSFCLVHRQIVIVYIRVWKSIKFNCLKTKHKVETMLDQDNPIYKLLPFLLSGLCPRPLPPLVSTKAVPKPMITTSRRMMIRESITDCFPWKWFVWVSKDISIYIYINI